jgi:putative endonuclease
MPEKMYFVYFMTNKYNNVLYIGVTGNLKERVWQHKTHQLKGFTSKNNCEKIVYYEKFDEITNAISREKRLKKWHRDWKDALVNRVNPLWEDLWNNDVMWWID